MATPSFTRQFTVKQEKSSEFLTEMSKTAVPTLPPDFKSAFVSLQQNQELKNRIFIALNN